MSLKGLILEGLSWTTTDADILKILEEKTETLVEIHFDQHPYNGKSCGSVYLRFTTSAAAQAAKKPLEKKYNVSLATKNPYSKSRDTVPEATSSVVPQMTMDPSAMFAGFPQGDQWAAYQAAMQPGSHSPASPKRHKKKRSSRSEKREERSEKREEREKPERRISDVCI
jgi:hypothetical protein